MTVNPILMQVFKNRFASISEEMGVTLNRTAFSPNIKERRDCSCAIFDAAGEMIAQAAHIPVHLGSMPLSVRAAIDCCQFEEGDMVMLNNPFQVGPTSPTSPSSHRSSTAARSPSTTWPTGLITPMLVA